MAKSSEVQPCPLDRTGCLFKLIDTFPVEMGELKRERGQTTVSLDGDPAMVALSGAEELVSGVFLQPPSSGGAPGTRDSGYSSLRRRMSVLDRLVQTHPVWLQLSLSEEEAAHILELQPPGTFLVRKSCKLQKKVISLRLDETASTVLHRDFPVKEGQYTFSLEGSGISFADLFRLVAFYCVSRDVLPFPLRLPEAIAGARTHAELEEVAEQGAAFWDSAGRRRDSPQLRRDQGWRGATLPALRTRAPSQLECSRPNGALCFINPLFLRTHRLPEEPSAPKPPSTARGKVAWVNSEPPPTKTRDPGSDTARDGRAMPETASWIGASPSAGPASAPIDVPPAQVLLRPHPDSLDDSLSPHKRPGSTEEADRNAPGGLRLSNISSSSSSDSVDFSPEIFLQGPGASAVGDSSLEDEEEDDFEARAGSDPESTPSPSSRPSRLRRSSFALPTTLKGKFRKMSDVFSALRTPEKRLQRQVLELSQDKDSYFGSLVQDHISFLQENRGAHTSGEDLLQTLRQFMTQLKAYLCQSSELDPSLLQLIHESQIDEVLEKAMHKCVLKPLKGVVDAALRDCQVSSGAWQQLRENLPLAKAKEPQELGVEGAVPPDPDAIERIRHKFQVMCKLYSPEKKVAMLLRVCKQIYTIMEDNSERLYGADDFLPMLTYVLAQCEMPQLDAEIQYMMELLDPSLLQGEGGYYLTSAYGAMALIRNFQEEKRARTLSSETRNTLHQWHRRRTSERVRPCIEDFQNYLRVALLEAGGGCTAKTFPVPPAFTTADVCRLCARRFRVAEPESHALFLLTGDSVQQLAPDTRPQRIKAELHGRPRAPRFHFLYRRVSRPPADRPPRVGGIRHKPGENRPVDGREEGGSSEGVGF